MACNRGTALNSLYLLRHADAGAPPAGKTDMDRHLNDRGIQTCQKIISNIREDDIHPDIILCSTATRTRETLDQIMSAWDEPIPVEYLDRIYEAHPEEIRAAIAEYTQAHNAIMVIGHNPGLQMLAMGLSENQAGNAFRETATNFAPGSLAKLTVHPELWEDVEPGKFTYLKLMTA
jgi:phosphohistidine phosphatase